MNQPQQTDPATIWMCHKCGVPLEPQKVSIMYLRSCFSTILPACPRCGMVYVSENLAVQRMAEAEKILEDK